MDALADQKCLGLVLGSGFCGRLRVDQHGESDGR